MAETTNGQKDYTQAEFIEEADRLQMDNFQLKIQNLLLQKQVAEHSIDSIDNMLASIQQKAIEFRKQLDTKYGMPITPNAVDRTGRLQRPRPIPDSIAAPPKEN